MAVECRLASRSLAEYLECSELTEPRRTPGPAPTTEECSAALKTLARLAERDPPWDHDQMVRWCRHKERRDTTRCIAAARTREDLERCDQLSR